MRYIHAVDLSGNTDEDRLRVLRRWLIAMALFVDNEERPARQRVDGALENLESMARALKTHKQVRDISDAIDAL